MIHIQNGRLSYGSQVLFDGISLTIGQNQRVGVLGRNGTGKSTLLKIIAGLESFDDGSVTIDGDAKIGYMPQEMVLLSSKSVFDEALSTFESLVALEKEKIELEEKLTQGADATDSLERYTELLEKCSSFDAADARARTEKILKGLGFSVAMFEQPVTELSVGWKMRLVLAKLLLEDADFYLFDEPTNHLDLPTKEWFFEFLKHGRFGFLLVTHDRHYLEQACDYILALERSQAIFFRGNLSAYIKEREHQQELLHAAYVKQQKEITRKQATIERFRASASKAKMAQSMIKQLDKVERIEIEPLLPTINLSFPAGVRPGHIILTLSNIKHAFEGRTLFDHVNGTIMRGDRIALVAPNGTGKTTLFNLITGSLPLMQGSIDFGTNVSYAVFEQDQMRALNPKNTVFEEVCQAIPDVTEGAIRTFLGSFLFSGDTIHKKISVLSGGERNRVAMVKVLLQKANLLLLDEPTNHLDLYAKDVLMQALKQYQGTMLFVSHDHSFLEMIATRIWELTPDGIHDYPGTYESYLYAKKNLENNIQQPQPAQKKQEIKPEQSSKNQYETKKQIASLESKIEKNEKEIQRLTQQFAEVDYGSTHYKELETKLAAVRKQLSENTVLWEQLIHAR